MRDPKLSYRIKLVLTVSLLAVVAAFSVLYLTGQAREKAAREAAFRDAEEALQRGVEIPP